MRQHRAGIQHIARAGIVALATAGVLSAVSSTASADVDVYQVSTQQELRAALADANYCANSVVIEISGVIEVDDTYAQDGSATYVGTPDVSCTQTVTLQGVTSDAALVSTGTTEYGVLLQLQSSGVVEVLDLRIADFVGEPWGAIASYGDISVSGSVFDNNAAPVSAGGAIMSQGNVSAVETVFTDNTALMNGGGAIFAHGTITLDTVEATGNIAHFSGAFTALGDATVIDSEFTGNTSTVGSGGALTAKAVTVIDSTFSANQGMNGGAIFADGAMELTGSTFHDNTSTSGYGGAARGVQHTVVTDSTFTENSSPTRGGAVYSAASLTVTDSTFAENESGSGGALSGDSATEFVTVTRSVFDGNTALTTEGGAVWAPHGHLTVTQSSFTSNEGTLGGAISASGSFDLSHSTFYDNGGGSYGGAAYLDGSGSVSFLTVVANSQTFGGALQFFNGDVAVTASVVAGSESLTSERECSASNAQISSGGYNAFGELGCVDTLDSSDQVRAFGEDFGLEEIAVGAVGYHFAPVAGGPLYDAIAADHSLCIGHDRDQNGDARPYGLGCDIGAVESSIDPEPEPEPPYVATEPPFVDVPLSHPFVDEIAWLATTGVTTGYADDTFRPSGAVSRQAMAAFLMRFAEVDDFEAPATATFADVPTTHDFFEEIEWLASTGITQGYSDGTFRGGGAVSRQAMAAFLMRFAEVDDLEASATATFADVPTTHVFFEEIEWLVDAGITTGYDDGTFRGGDTVTRQATAAFLYRLHFAE